MRRLPNVVGLKMCKHAIIEEKTRNLTLVNCFHSLSFRDFPALAAKFTVCVVLGSGQGDCKLTLEVTSLEDWKDIWSHSWKVSFSDPLVERSFLMPVSNCMFPTRAVIK